MNREIKFRAWHKEFGEMVYTKGNTIFEKREFSPFVFEVGFSHYPQDDWQIMQFTGLTDKNGKEIYEGDILEKSVGLKLNGRIPQFRPIVGSIKKVIFHEGAWKITKSNHSSNYYINSVTIRYYGFEVVGNIYENPELIS